MCTYTTTSTRIVGSGKGPKGWFPVTQAAVGYDHAMYHEFDHAIVLDFMNPDRDPSDRVALELTIASSKVLLEQLREAIEAAEATGIPG